MSLLTTRRALLRRERDNYTVEKKYIDIHYTDVNFAKAQLRARRGCVELKTIFRGGIFARFLFLYLASAKFVSPRGRLSALSRGPELGTRWFSLVYSVAFIAIEERHNPAQFTVDIKSERADIYTRERREKEIGFYPRYKYVPEARRARTYIARPPVALTTDDSSSSGKMKGVTEIVVI